MRSDTKSLRAIFLEALKRETPEERDSYLNRACRGDPELRDRAVALLRAHGQAGNFLGGDPPDSLPDAGPVREPAGREIGPYRLLEEIGEGAFGIVYVAEQTEPVRRRVAMKLIKPGMASREVLARFAFERQALALMDHPGIARVFDAGATEEGHPYVVMELVHGIPVTAYCDRSQLGIRDRLTLFVEVCRAVQHAHQKGVIHRDLKPSNVLVAMRDGVPTPKVIDFGVAKATGPLSTGKAFYTRFAQMVGTPQYMSPEQAEMSPLEVDTRSDIYSLGVLLYELLTGTPPFSLDRLVKVDFDEFRRIIREEEPETPSNRLHTGGDESAEIAARRRADPRELERAVKGDLDWIVMKALEKDPVRRYETAEGLARDVSRYLEHQPVEARPPSRWYRLRKLARRNRAAVTTAAVALFFLVLLGVVIGWTAGDRAARRQAIEHAVSGALAEAETAYREGRLHSARAAMERAEGLLRGGSDDETLFREVHRWRRDLEMLRRLDAARMVRAEVKHSRFDLEGAAASLADAFRWYGIDPLEMEAESVTAAIRESRIRDELVAAANEWLFTERQLALLREEPSDAVPRLRRFLAQADPAPWRRRLRDLDPGKPDELVELARRPEALEQPPEVISSLGNGLITAGRPVAAVDLLRRRQQGRPGDLWLNQMLGLAYLYTDPPDLDEAVRFFQAAVALRPESPGMQLNLGIALQRRGDLEEAEARYREALRIKRDYTGAWLNLAGIHEERGETRRRLDALRRAMEADPDSHRAREFLGLARVQTGEVEEGTRDLVKAVEMRPQCAVARTHLAWAYGLSGEREAAFDQCLRAIERAPNLEMAHVRLMIQLQIPPGADVDLEEIVAVCRKATKVEEPIPVAFSSLGLAQLRNGDVGTAETTCREARRRDPESADTLLALGIVLYETGRPAKALELFEQANELRSDDPRIPYYQGHARSALGDYAGAIDAFQRSAELEPNPRTSHALGGTLMFLRRNREAIEAFRDAIDGSPTWHLPYISLGHCLSHQDDLTGALEEIDKALELEPNDVLALGTRALVLQEHGQIEQAIQGYEAVLEMDPDLVPAHVSLAKLLMRLAPDAEPSRAEKLTERAIRHFDAADRLSPGNPLIQNALAWVLATTPDPTLRDPGRAVALAEKAVGSVRWKEATWNTLGVARYYNGDYQEACEALHTSLRLGSTVPCLDRLFLAMANWRLGRELEARDAFWKAATCRSPHRDNLPELDRFRTEAEHLLGIEFGTGRDGD